MVVVVGIWGGGGIGRNHEQVGLYYDKDSTKFSCVFFLSKLELSMKYLS